MKLAKIIEEMADMWAFAAHWTGLDVKPAKRSQDSGLGATIDTFIGAGGTMSFITTAFGVGTSIDTSSRYGFKGNFDFSYQFQNESSITSSSSLSMTDKLEMHGNYEQESKFPHLGIRFIPKNIGYALVVSALADVFITRLARSGKMVGYQVQPVDGIPPDVNTITFLINPAYTMNGSLDGLTGSSATSDRFFKHIRAGKRNIVNTYVWDADGGLRTEAQSFANTVEHTIGGSFTMNAGLGVNSSFTAFGVDVELTAQATVNLTQTMNKTEARSKGFQLNVDLSGVEFRGITDYNDQPILPGEKVDRYRFMSFYLEGSTQHFQDFFSYVVDPKWLASNDEEARALRQAQAGKPNKAWRVLHRVTYVERPALMGFGRDVRKLRVAAAISENQQLLDKIAKLEENNRKLEKKLDDILDKLK